MKTVILIKMFLLGTLLFFFSVISVAQPKEIVIGTSTGYPPFYYNENGEMKGICIEVIDHVLKRLDIKAVYKQYSWEGMINNGKAGKVDAVMPLFKNKEREEFLFFADNRIAIESNQFFVKSDSKLYKFTDYDALESLKIGVVSGYSYVSEFDDNEALNKKSFYNDEGMINAIITRRVSIAIGNQEVITYKANKLNINKDELRFLMPLITELPLYIGFSRKKNHKDLSEQFSKELAIFKSSPAYQEILNNY